MGAREAAEIAFHGTRVVPATPEGEAVSTETTPAAYPPDVVAPMPNDLTETTPQQHTNWHLADAVYLHGFASHYIRKGDHKAAAEQFVKSGAAFAVAHLTRALVEHAPDKADEVIKDLHETFEFGDLMERSYQWLHESGVDAHSLYEAGVEKAKDTPALEPSKEPAEEIERLRRERDVALAGMATSYSEGVEDMRSAAMRIPATIGTQDLQSMRVVYEQIRDVSLTDTVPAPAPRDSHLAAEVRALVKRYGAPMVAHEAARFAKEGP